MTKDEMIDESLLKERALAMKHGQHFVEVSGELLKEGRDEKLQVFVVKKVLEFELRIHNLECNGCILTPETLPHRGKIARRS